MKRERARAIIIKDNKLVTMYREFDDRVFYVFPGGGMEGDESEKECVVREVYEEFGINVKPIKKLYVYENEKSIEYFYLSEWIDGEFATGKGEEFVGGKDGVYIPKLIDMTEIANIPLMPPEVAQSLCEDYLKNALTIREDVKSILTSDNKKRG